MSCDYNYAHDVGQVCP